MKKYLKPLIVGVSEERGLFPAAIATLASLSAGGAAVVGVASGLAVGRRVDLSQKKWSSLTGVIKTEKQLLEVE